MVGGRRETKEVDNDTAGPINGRRIRGGFVVEEVRLESFVDRG